jgi:hypothetical protein
MTTLPEPPDGTRIEFEWHSDVYGAWRDDDSSVEAGYEPSVGWCIYPESVPMTWADMIGHFGEDALRLAVRLTPHPDDVANMNQWPTAIWAREKQASGGEA